MKYRKLRIAWSVAWGVVAVLLCVLWVRSYKWSDRLVYISPTFRCFLDAKSILGVIVVEGKRYKGKERIVFIRHDNVMSARMLVDNNNRRFDDGWFHAIPHTVIIPQWFPVLIAGVVAVVPWICYRFSLRTLLIATTLVAVALGLIVWASR